MTDIVKYISRYIPPFIEPALKCASEKDFIHGKKLRWKTKNVFLEFNIFVNHAHYDIRFGYFPLEGDIIFKHKHGSNRDFLYLYENIDSQAQLLKCLKELRKELLKDNRLSGHYATKEGYTVKKYEAGRKEVTIR